MSRRGRGEGSLFYDDQRKRWVGVLDLGVKPDGKRNRPKVSGKTKTEAKNKLDELRRAAGAGLAVADGKYTVAMLMADWLAYGLRDDLSGNSMLNYRNRAVVVTAGLGARRLRDLSGKDVLTWLRGLDYGQRQLHNVHTTLTRAITWAQSQDYVARNVSATVTTPKAKPKRATRDRRSLTVDEAARLLDRADGVNLAIVAVGLYAGLRCGEIAGLRWADVNLTTGTLTVTQQVKRDANGVYGLGTPKSKSSRRTIAIAPDLVSILRERRKEVATWKLAAGDLWEDHDLIICDQAGHWLRPATITARIRRAGEAADLAPLTVHELRHTAASILIDMGHSAEAVADMLGHADASQVIRTYRHAVSEVASAGKALSFTTGAEKAS